MKEIIVKTQKEMDAVALNFDGIIKVLGLKIVVKARYRYRVEARGNASVVARENASVVAWGNACIRISTAIKSLSMFGFSVLFKPFDLKFTFKRSATAHVQKVRQLPFLERDGVKQDDGSVVLFKRVSEDWKTQEGTPSETVWTPGTKVTHPAWDPTSGECGPGKFHACSRPYFCDLFRSEPSDRYVAINIKVEDLYEWPNPEYSHKVAFREGKVLYECDRMGRRREANRDA